MVSRKQARLRSAILRGLTGKDNILGLSKSKAAMHAMLELAMQPTTTKPLLRGVAATPPPPLYDAGKEKEDVEDVPTPAFEVKAKVYASVTTVELTDSEDPYEFDPYDTMDAEEEETAWQEEDVDTILDADFDDVFQAIAESALVYERKPDEPNYAKDEEEEVRHGGSVSTKKMPLLSFPAKPIESVVRLPGMKRAESRALFEALGHAHCDGSTLCGCRPRAFGNVTPEMRDVFVLPSELQMIPSPRELYPPQDQDAIGLATVGDARLLSAFMQLAQQEHGVNTLMHEVRINYTSNAALSTLVAPLNLVAGFPALECLTKNPALQRFYQHAAATIVETLFALSDPKHDVAVARKLVALMEVRKPLFRRNARTEAYMKYVTTITHVLLFILILVCFLFRFM